MMCDVTRLDARLHGSSTGSWSYYAAPADVFVLCSSLVTVVTFMIGYRSIVSRIANEFVVVVFESPNKDLALTLAHGRSPKGPPIGKPARSIKSDSGLDAPLVPD
ncbi:hypothetical protein TWF788_001353 [Orbilia oligospora]|uniref:Uncharacterized protein n=1 Tax=Orbilia oligospora TaxID=2813651 RepID=A0A7C8KJV6_ORBOL|nr:hypothetical protein TWF788_001353 [Orbilia oligospora]